MPKSDKPDPKKTKGKTGPKGKRYAWIDYRLLTDMASLVLAGEAKSPNDAARQVAELAWAQYGPPIGASRAAVRDRIYRTFQANPDNWLARSRETQKEGHSVRTKLPQTEPFRTFAQIGQIGQKIYKFASPLTKIIPKPAPSKPEDD